MNNKKELIELAKQIYHRDFYLGTTWNQAVQEAKAFLLTKELSRYVIK